MPQRYAPTSRPYSFCRGLCRIFTTTFLDMKVYGLEHVPLTGGVLLLSNHQSYLDPICLTDHLRRPAGFLAKSELFDVPVFGYFIRKLNAYPVRQGAGDVGAVRETIARLKEGRLLTIFPEGSRTSDGEILPLQGGFALVVRKVDVPIVPCAIDGTFKAWSRNAIMPQRTPVRVQYGPPLELHKLKASEIVPKVSDAIAGLFAELRRKRAAELDLELGTRHARR